MPRKKQTSATPPIKHKFKVPTRFDDYLSIDYDSGRECPDYCGSSGDYCHHNTINNAIVEEIYDGIEQAFIIKSSPVPNNYDILLYCLERFCSRLSVDDFYVNIDRGYYGQEIGDITLENSNIATELVDILNGGDTQQAIEFVLSKEYGYLLDELQNKQWYIKEVDLSEILIGNEYRKLDVETIQKYKDSKKYSCLCIKKENGYRLIDGFHRHRAAIENKDKTIKVIYCE